MFIVTAFFQKKSSLLILPAAAAADMHLSHAINHKVAPQLQAVGGKGGLGGDAGLGGAATGAGNGGD
jgi:hypothetical protein